MPGSTVLVRSDCQRAAARMVAEMSAHRQEGSTVDSQPPARLCLKQQGSFAPLSDIQLHRVLSQDQPSTALRNSTIMHQPNGCR